MHCYDAKFSVESLFVFQPLMIFKIYQIKCERIDITDLEMSNYVNFKINKRVETFENKGTTLI